MSANIEQKKRQIDLILILCLLLGLAQRLWFLIHSGWAIESDEAIVGLMAKHIAEGKEWPIFYYGQYYMGSLEAIFVALLFSLVGISNVTLKLVPFLFSLIHIYLVYLLAKSLAGRGVARLAALFTAVAPVTLIVWSSKPRGGFIELVVIGTWCLYLAVVWLKSAKQDSKTLLLLGFLLGLGWWVNNQILFYMVAIGVVFAWHYLRSYPFAKTGKDVLTALLSFLLGSSLFWYANLISTPRFQSWGNLGHQASPDKVWSYFVGFLTEALPILLGARNPWEYSDVFTGAGPIAAFIYFICLIAFIVYIAKQKQSADALILVFVAVVPLIFSTSGFGWLSQEPRYLLPMYSVLGIVEALAVSYLWQSKYLGLKYLAPILALSIVLLNVYSNYGRGGYLPGEPFVYEGERVSKDHSVLYQWLKQERYDHIITNYWIGYRVAFETKEAVTFTHFMEPRTLRIKEYERDGWWQGQIYPYVLVPKQAQEYARWLNDLGYNFRLTNLGSYVVIDRVVPMYFRNEKIILTPEQIVSTQRPEWRERMIDGDMGTRWGSGLHQTPGMSITVNLDGQKTVGSLSLELGFWTTDRARELFIEGQTNDGQWCVIFSTAGNLKFYEETARTLDLYFKPQPYKAIRLIQTGKHPVLDWSIAELSLYKVEN
ncbi:MAG: glycosyltransferase family 39 protein [Deltaproteobacteria bacterium]|nr:glycosyltransferase family 39 protein [Deltaproteobacteria bacterium]